MKRTRHTRARARERVSTVASVKQYCSVLSWYVIPPTPSPPRPPGSSLHRPPRWGPHPPQPERGRGGGRRGRVALLSGTMADEGDEVVVEPIQPAVVEYEPATGMPPEYCEYLPKEEFMKSLKWLSENRSFGECAHACVASRASGRASVYLTPCHPVRAAHSQSGFRRIAPSSRRSSSRRMSWRRS